MNHYITTTAPIKLKHKILGRKKTFGKSAKFAFHDSSINTYLLQQENKKVRQEDALSRFLDRGSTN